MNRRMLGSVCLAFLLVGCVGLGNKPGLRLHPEHFAAIDADLRAFAARQQRELEIPGVWIALLDVDPETGAEHLWAAHVGGPVNSLPSAQRVAERDALRMTHRVASISKLYTDTAAMVLAECGMLDLDADVRTWLEDFAPRNPFGVPVTLRHLMGHRAGIVRESPVGHYFDPSEPSLAATVLSLNDTALVSRPGDTYKYSNPGIGIVGEVVARVTGKPFERAVRELVLEPLGLEDSDFAPRRDLLERQADGVMWTYDGREIPTPNWRFGYVPAAELRATVTDLVRFARSWFVETGQRVLTPAAQERMWQLPAGRQRGCGLGFFVSEFDGHRRVGHGGAVYGFASTLTALPDAGLAVAVVCNRDFCNDIADAIAERALRAALANRRGETLPPAVFPAPLGVEAARALQGRWRCGENWVELKERGGELYYDPNIGVRTRLRRHPSGELVADDPLQFDGARRLRRLPNGNLHDGEVEYVRDVTVPPAAPRELEDLLGEYGWDHNVLYVYEDGGQLAVLIEWVVRDIPVREGPDRYRFPDGMYRNDQLVFERDQSGAVTAAVVGGARFPRRQGPSAGTFKMEPVRPVSELVAAARTQQPPPQLTPADARPFDLVDLMASDNGGDDAKGGLQFDIRYASTDNFLGAKVYDAPFAMLQRPAAEALLRAHAKLRSHGVGIRIFDAYRPWWVTKVFWDAAPRHLKLFVADPMRGSRHNRGCAVDLTLFDLATGEPIEMPSGYDEFTPRAYPDYPGGTARQRYYRELLRQTMAAEGFDVYEHEWWHFDHRDWRAYGVGNHQP